MINDLTNLQQCVGFNHISCMRLLPSLTTLTSWPHSVCVIADIRICGLQCPHCGASRAKLISGRVRRNELSYSIDMQLWNTWPYLLKYLMLPTVFFKKRGLHFFSPYAKPTISHRTLPQLAHARAANKAEVNQPGQVLHAKACHLPTLTVNT